MLGQPNFCRFEVRYFLALLGHNKATLIGLGTVIDPNSNIDYTVGMFSTASGQNFKTLELLFQWRKVLPIWT